ncbi:MAG: NAD(P)/FAD-dependent oxidoreductase [Acidimicrobiales bacterium]
MQMANVVIVGAGLSGLIAARQLATPGSPSSVDGLATNGVVLLEASGAVGGRLATDTIGDAVLDHGAQFFTVRTEELATDVESWTERGVVEEWCRGFAEDDGYPRYRVAGGMVNLARSLADDVTDLGVTVATDAVVTSIEAIDTEAATAKGNTVEGRNATEDGWLVRFEDDRDPIAASAVILTPPVPLSLPILDAGNVARTEDATTLDGFTYHKVAALLTVLDGSPELPPPGALQQPADDVFSFISDNQAKGISPVPAVTFHTAHARSAELWSADDDELLEALLPAARSVVAPAEIIEVEVVRWPYTGPVSSHPERCLIAAAGPTGPIVLAGDGFGGSKVEGAYSSGRAAAEVIAAALRSD